MFLEFVHVRSCDFCGFWRFEAHANCILPAYFFSSAKSCIPWIRGWTFVAAQREWTGDRSLSRLSWKISGRSQQGLRCTDINRIHGDSMPQNPVYFSESKLNDGEFPMSHTVHAVAWLHSLWSLIVPCSTNLNILAFIVFAYPLVN